MERALPAGHSVERLVRVGAGGAGGAPLSPRPRHPHGQATLETVRRGAGGDQIGAEVGEGARETVRVWTVFGPVFFSPLAPLPIAVLLVAALTVRG